VTISETVAPRLRTKFQSDGLQLGVAPGPIATVPARCAEVGDLQIFDHGEEVIVHIGHVSHTHISAYYTSSHEERVQSVADDLIEFVENLLSDRILFWAAGGETRQGGVVWGYTGVVPASLPKNASVFLWSRRLK
jgi:hypothetical protein